jgi:pilus assembly protein CpaF
MSQIDTTSLPASANRMGLDELEVFMATVNHYLAPVMPFLEDERVTEVMINNFEQIYAEKDGKMVKCDCKFDDVEAYEAAVNNVLQFTGKSLADENPLIDARLPNGSRVHVARPPCARFGTVMTIRKFNTTMLDIDWLMHLGSFTKEAAEYMQVAVQSERNMLVSGGTSSGKTSLLNALSAFIPDGERVVVIEDSAELQLQQEHVVSLESKPPDEFGRGAVGIRELFRSSLRLRPDRIIIGEVRGGEALDMIQAMTSGHGGSMGTLHANNTSDALNRLETLALMSKVELPLHALRGQVASALDVILQMSRHLGGKRMITQISEVEPLGDDGHYKLRDIYNLQHVPTADDPKAMALKWTGLKSNYANYLRPGDRELVTELTQNVFEADDK